MKVKRPTNFKARGWRQLLLHYAKVQDVADRLSQRHRDRDALFTDTVNALRDSGLTLRQALVRMLRDMRAARKEVRANTCPYCGGAYTLARACNGPRTATIGENACARMALHARLVRDAAQADELAAECDR